MHLLLLTIKSCIVNYFKKSKATEMKFWPNTHLIKIKRSIKLWKKYWLYCALGAWVRNSLKAWLKGMISIYQFEYFVPELKLKSSPLLESITRIMKFSRFWVSLRFYIIIYIKSIWTSCNDIKNILPNEDSIFSITLHKVFIEGKKMNMRTRKKKLSR